MQSSREPQNNPYKVETRKQLTPKQRLRLFIERDGICWRCKTLIDGVHEKWIDEHVDPLWLNGLNCWSNRDITHERCAREKTAEEATVRSKVRSVAEFHYGAKQSIRPMPCGRRSRWKRKMDGTVVLRDQE